MRLNCLCKLERIELGELIIYMTIKETKLFKVTGIKGDTREITTLPNLTKMSI